MEGVEQGAIGAVGIRNGALRHNATSNDPARPIRLFGIANTVRRDRLYRGAVGAGRRGVMERPIQREQSVTHW